MVTLVRQYDRGRNAGGLAAAKKNSLHGQVRDDPRSASEAISSDGSRTATVTPTLAEWFTHAEGEGGRVWRRSTCQWPFL